MYNIYITILFQHKYIILTNEEYLIIPIHYTRRDFFHDLDAFVTKKWNMKAISKPVA